MACIISLNVNVDTIFIAEYTFQLLIVGSIANQIVIAVDWLKLITTKHDILDHDSHKWSVWYISMSP